MKYIIYLLVLIQVGCLNAQNKGVINLAKTVVNPFAGFTFLSTPRSDVQIGTEWLQDFGPKGIGLSDTNLINVKSIDSGTINGSSDFKINTEARILTFLGINLDINRQKGDSIHFEKAEIVTVKDVNRINWIKGASYIWEALKITEFTVKSNRLRKDLLHASLQRSDQTNAVVQEVTTTGSKSFYIKGVDLFIAIRVVQSVASKKKEIKTNDLTGKNSGDLIEINSRNSTKYQNFRVSLSPLADTSQYGNNIITNLQEPIGRRCKVLMTVVSSNVLFQPPPPKQWAVDCNKAGRILILSSETATNGFESYELDLGDDLFTIENGSKAKFRGIIKLNYRKIQLRNINPRANGWAQ